MGYSGKISSGRRGDPTPGHKTSSGTNRSDYPLVAILKKIALGGVIIRQASLHNLQDLTKKDLRRGDFVLIHRAGDVIPEVIKTIKEKRAKNSKPFKLPDVCPECQSPLSFQGDELMCKNPHCPAVKKSRFIHFASKKAMNIEFLGEKSLKKFYQWGWLKNYSDFYELKNKPITDKEGFGEKSYSLLVESLEKSKKTKLSNLIFALGIPLIGEQSANKISEQIDKISKKQKLENINIKTALPLLKNISLEELEGLGPMAGRSFKTAFENKDLLLDLEKLHEKGVRFLKTKNHEGSLSGWTFAITGKLPLAREKIKEMIIKEGGRMTSQISRKTDFLLVGDKSGSKKRKAQTLGLKTLDWDGFLKMVYR